MFPKSSFFGDGLLHSNVSCTNCSVSFYMQCISSSPGSVIFITFTATNMFFLLPACTLIIYHGWKKNSAFSAAAKSHSDIFVYHLVSMELIGVLGNIFTFSGIFKEDLNILKGGVLFAFFIWFGETFFHMLTCIERYLAVVRPVTYLSLKTKQGVRIQNMGIGCVWLLCVLGVGMTLIEDIFNIFSACIMTLSIASISFCSFSVLYVLVHQAPEQQCGKKVRLHRTKLRAFYTIVIILGVLVLRFAYGVVWTILNATQRKSDCIMIASHSCFTMPSSLVLPLLFLHRREKLMRWKKHIK